MPDVFRKSADAMQRTNDPTIATDDPTTGDRLRFRAGMPSRWLLFQGLEKSG